MLLNTRSILYLFDLDGTLIGDSHWSGNWHNDLSLFKSPIYINPSEKNIRWSILTGRPKIDHLLIKLVCGVKNLTPHSIITQDAFFYRNKNMEEVYNWKCRYIKNILKEKGVIEKIYYIDSDYDCIRYLNHNRDNYEYLGLTPLNFIKEDFKFYM